MPGGVAGAQPNGYTPVPIEDTIGALSQSLVCHAGGCFATKPD